MHGPFGTFVRLLVASAGLAEARAAAGCIRPRGVPVATRGAGRVTRPECRLSGFDGLVIQIMLWKPTNGFSVSRVEPALLSVAPNVVLRAAEFN